MVERRLPNILMLETKACTFVIIFEHYEDVDVLDCNDTDFVQIVRKIFNWTFEVPT